MINEEEDFNIVDALGKNDCQLTISGWTPLHYAANNLKENVMEYLVQLQEINGWLIEF